MAEREKKIARVRVEGQGGELVRGDVAFSHKSRRRFVATRDEGCPGTIEEAGAKSSAGELGPRQLLAVITASVCPRQGSTRKAHKSRSAPSPVHEQVPERVCCGHKTKAARALLRRPMRKILQANLDRGNYLQQALRWRAPGKGLHAHCAQVPLSHKSRREQKRAPAV